MDKNEIAKIVLQEFEKDKEINDAINVLSDRLGLTYAQVNNAIRQLCLSGQIIPSPHRNTFIPEEIEREG
jgi:hypothetical protein